MHRPARLGLQGLSGMHDNAAIAPAVASAFIFGAPANLRVTHRTGRSWHVHGHARFSRQPRAVSGLMPQTNPSSMNLRARRMPCLHRRNASSPCSRFMARRCAPYAAACSVQRSNSVGRMAISCPSPMRSTSNVRSNWRSTSARRSMFPPLLRVVMPFFGRPVSLLA